MKSRLMNVAFAGARGLLLLASGVIVLLAFPGPASAQESLGFRLPDSIRVGREPFFLPSFSFVPSPFLGNQFSLQDEAMIPPPGILNTYNASWKRSFLLGATVDRTDIFHLPPVVSKKEGWFQRIGIAIGYAEFVGAAYLGYKAIKKEPITKPKDPKKK